MDREKEIRSFECFFRQNFEKFYQYALLLLNDEEASRDIVSDVMEYVWQEYRQRTPQQWFNYSVSFIRNKCVDHIRHKAVHKKYADFYTYVVDHKDLQPVEGSDERMEDIQKAMGKLSAKTQLVLQECYINRKSYKEVAEEMEMSTNGVKKHIVHALKSIREEIAKKYKKE